MTTPSPQRNAETGKRKTPKEVTLKLKPWYVALIYELCDDYCAQCTSYIKENHASSLKKIIEKQAPNCAKRFFVDKNWETRVHIKINRQCLQCKNFCMPWALPKTKSDFPFMICGNRKVGDRFDPKEQSP